MRWHEEQYEKHMEALEEINRKPVGKGTFWVIVSKCEQRTILWQYARRTKNLCLSSVYWSAKEEGFSGTAQERCNQLGWEPVELFYSPNDQ